MYCELILWLIGQMINSRTALRMSEDEAAVEKSVDVEQDMRARGLDARRKSFFSRYIGAAPNKHSTWDQHILYVCL
jgi:hypothetical protein